MVVPFVLTLEPSDHQELLRHWLSCQQIFEAGQHETSICPPTEEASRCGPLSAQEMLSQLTILQAPELSALHDHPVTEA